MEWNGTPSNLTMRKPGSFVGLENGGATGYINCILQQLYMVEEFRNMIIGLDIKLDDESSANYGECGEDDSSFCCNLHCVNELTLICDMRWLKSINIISVVRFRLSWTNNIVFLLGILFTVFRF